MRLFIATEIETDITTKLGLVQNKLKKTGADIKWVKPENMHFTYHFLGKLEEEKITVLKRIMDSCRNKARFKIKFTGLKTFPDLKKPRVLWLDVEDKNSSMAGIFGTLAKELEKYGFGVDSRPYIAHLTIGRIKSGRNLENLKKEISNSKIDFAETEINNIGLFESILTPDGPVYKKIYTVRFTK